MKGQDSGVCNGVGVPTKQIGNGKSRAHCFRQNLYAEVQTAGSVFQKSFRIHTYKIANFRRKGMNNMPKLFGEEYGKMLKEKQKLTERERFWYPLYRNNEYIFLLFFFAKNRKRKHRKTLFIDGEKKS